MENILNKALEYYKSDPNYNEAGNLLENVYFRAIEECLGQCYERAKNQKDFDSLSDIQKEYTFYEALYDFWRKEIHQIIDNENFINNIK